MARREAPARAEAFDEPSAGFPAIGESGVGFEAIGKAFPFVTAARESAAGAEAIRKSDAVLILAAIREPGAGPQAFTHPEARVATVDISDAFSRALGDGSSIGMAGGKARSSRGREGLTSREDR